MALRLRIMVVAWLLSLLISFTLASSTVLGSTRFVLLDESTRVANNTKCTNQNIRVRKEWRRLSTDEKQAYLKAVQCLHENPPKTKQFFEGVHSRYDDFIALHMNATNGGIHNVGVFLPWHRLTVWTYESVLRSECGYTGAQPYWDYTLDTPENGGHFNTSPVFDPINGFGGDGKVNKTDNKMGCSSGKVCSGGCVTDGPFAKYQVYLGPGNSFKSNPRCLKRQINSGVEAGAASKNINSLLGRSTFESFQSLDSGGSFASKNFVPGVHSIGHFGVGGDMTNLWSSTNDPLFWMHHTELDRLWALWAGNNETRLADVAAPTTVSLGSLLGAKGAKTSVQTMVWMGQFPPSLTIGQVADTQNRNGMGVLCYKYEG